MKSYIKELIDQATIFCGAKTSEEIANYLETNNVIALPVRVGDKAYFLSCRGTFGSLLTSGCVIERTVDAIEFDGKGFKVISHRPMPDDRDGNLYEYWNEKVFRTKEEAEMALDQIKNAAGV